MSYELSVSKSEIQTQEPPSLDVGIYEGLDADTYHALPYCSNSKLSKLAISARHLKHALDTPFDATTSSMRKGSALNTLVLEPRDWHKWSVYEHAGNTKAGKAERADAVSRHGEKHVLGHHLTMNEYTDVLGMQIAIESNKEARTLMTMQGERMNEVSIIFNWLGMLFKGRLDRMIYSPDVKLGIDLKTTLDASPDFMSKRIFNYGYHRQATIYMIGCAILGRPLDTFSIVAVENSAPYNCEVYELSESFIRLGLEEVEPLAKRYKYCVDNDYWPGYTSGAQVIEPPYWATRQDTNFNDLYLADLPRLAA